MKTNRFSVPYDFWATLLDMTMTERSPKASLLGVRIYWSRMGLEKKKNEEIGWIGLERENIPNEGLEIAGWTDDWVALELHSGQSLVDSMDTHLGITEILDFIVRWNVVIPKGRGRGLLYSTADDVGGMIRVHLGKEIRNVMLGIPFRRETSEPVWELLERGRKRDRGILGDASHSIVVWIIRGVAV